MVANTNPGIYSRDEETIIAQCTPQGSGAIALLRACGTNALSIISSISKLGSGKTIENVPTHTIHYGHVVNEQGSTIDHVMFMVMHGPKTFTGQHTVEITCHNNPFIVAQIIDRAIAHGARYAQEGEFTRRAFLNNKIDLIQAEAINELIHANTQLALKKSLAMLEGSFSHWVTALEDELYKALALSEASFEFIDEEISFGPQIAQRLTQTLASIATIKTTFDQQQQIRQGIRIALIGSVNAGKSSLFNALLKQERAIVTNIAGTTRDVIEAGLQKDGNAWTLIDTAGLRSTDDVIEQEGIRRSLSEAKKADIIILVYDSARPMTQQEHEIYQQVLHEHANKVIVVRNKIDLPSYTDLQTPQNVPVIAATNTMQNTIDQLADLISKKIAVLFASIDSPFLLNKRQFKLLLSIEQRLQEVLPMLQGTIAYELVSYHLKDILETLSELSGKTVSERGMDTVFREFCVGK